MWEEMQISNLFCALHSYSNSEGTPKWTLRKLTEIRDTVVCGCDGNFMQMYAGGDAI